MYKTFESAMSTTFDLKHMLNMIDTYHIKGNLTDAECDKLVAIAREKANPSGSMDVLAKLQELDDRVRALEQAGKSNAEPDAPEAVEEYIAGKWYRTGDQVKFAGKLYTCIAPEGTVCVWSPAEYPAYWEASV